MSSAVLMSYLSLGTMVGGTGGALGLAEMAAAEPPRRSPRRWQKVLLTYVATAARLPTPTLAGEEPARRVTLLPCQASQALARRRSPHRRCVGCCGGDEWPAQRARPARSAVRRWSAEAERAPRKSHIAAAVPRRSMVTRGVQMKFKATAAAAHRFQPRRLAGSNGTVDAVVPRLPRAPLTLRMGTGIK